MDKEELKKYLVGLKNNFKVGVISSNSDEHNELLSDIKLLKMASLSILLQYGQINEYNGKFEGKKGMHPSGGSYRNSQKATEEFYKFIKKIAAEDVDDNKKKRGRLQKEAASSPIKHEDEIKARAKKIKGYRTLNSLEGIHGSFADVAGIILADEKRANKDYFTKRAAKSIGKAWGVASKYTFDFTGAKSPWNYEKNPVTSFFLWKGLGIAGNVLQGIGTERKINKQERHAIDDLLQEDMGVHLWRRHKNNNILRTPKNFFETGDIQQIENKLNCKLLETNDIQILQRVRSQDGSLATVKEVLRLGYIPNSKLDKLKEEFNKYNSALTGTMPAVDIENFVRGLKSREVEPAQRKLIEKFLAENKSRISQMTEEEQAELKAYNNRINEVKSEIVKFAMSTLDNNMLITAKGLPEACFVTDPATGRPVMPPEFKKYLQEHGRFDAKAIRLLPGFEGKTFEEIAQEAAEAQARVFNANTQNVHSISKRKLSKEQQFNPQSFAFSLMNEQITDSIEEILAETKNNLEGTAEKYTQLSKWFAGVKADVCVFNPDGKPKYKLDTAGNPIKDPSTGRYQVETQVLAVDGIRKILGEDNPYWLTVYNNDENFKKFVVSLNGDITKWTGSEFNNFEKNINEYKKFIKPQHFTYKEMQALLSSRDVINEEQLILLLTTGQSRSDLQNEGYPEKAIDDLVQKALAQQKVDEFGIEKHVRAACSGKQEPEIQRILADTIKEQKVNQLVKEHMDSMQPSPLTKAYEIATFKEIEALREEIADKYELDTKDINFSTDKYGRLTIGGITEEQLAGNGIKRLQSIRARLEQFDSIMGLEESESSTFDKLIRQHKVQTRVIDEYLRLENKQSEKSHDVPYSKFYKSVYADNPAHFIRKIDQAAGYISKNYGIKREDITPSMFHRFAISDSVLIDELEKLKAVYGKDCIEDASKTAYKDLFQMYEEKLAVDELAENKDAIITGAAGLNATLDNNILAHLNSYVLGSGATAMVKTGSVMADYMKLSPEYRNLMNNFVKREILRKSDEKIDEKTRQFAFDTCGDNIKTAIEKMRENGELCNVRDVNDIARKVIVEMCPDLTEEEKLGIMKRLELGELNKFTEEIKKKGEAERTNAIERAKFSNPIYKDFYNKYIQEFQNDPQALWMACRRYGITPSAKTLQEAAMFTPPVQQGGGQGRGGGIDEDYLRRSSQDAAKAAADAAKKAAEEKAPTP